jgi:hypothetical protein
MLITKELEIEIARGNVKHYKELGYNCKVGDIITVKVEHLPKQSKIVVDVTCDYCGKPIKRQYSNHINQISKDVIKKDSCVECKWIKTKESNMMVYGVESTTQLEETQNKMKNTLIERYGVEHQMHLQETKDKIKNTCQEKYGVDYVSQAKEFQDKVKQINLEKYGVEYYTQTEEYKIKSKVTNLERYGCDNPMQNEEIRLKLEKTIIEKYGVSNAYQSEEIKEKIRQTNLKRYGFESAMQNEEIKNKCTQNMLNTMYSNGNIACSKQQKHIHELFGGELNYIIDRCALDIAFPNDKIYIEYNGGGHDVHVKVGRISEKEFKQKEIQRYMFLKSLGWKQILISSARDYLPQDDILLEELNNAYNILNTSKLNHYIIKISDMSYDDKYGKLQKL